MAISPYIAAIRDVIGSRLLLVPTVAVLPRDDGGRMLLVRQTDTRRWATIGGSIEPDEAPADAAVREAQEEAGVSVRLTQLLAVLGGPEYRLTYPNGDQTACVPVVYDAVVRSGIARPDGDETCEVAWFHADELGELDLNDINRCLLEAVVPMLRASP